jgi:hypothetical protein
MERAGDEVRSWFGDDEAERRRRMDEERERRERMYGRTSEYGVRGSETPRTYGRGPDDRMYARGAEYDYGWASERSGPPMERGWGNERWERPERWSGDYGRMEYDRSASGWRGWNEPSAGYGTWRGEHTAQRRPGESHGYYEDNRGRVYEFEHGPAWRAGTSGDNYGPAGYNYRSTGYNYGPGSYGPNYGYEGRNFTGRGPKGWKRPDDRIREDVCERLTADWQIDASEIEIVVNNGEVTLAGNVHTRDDKRRAEDVAEHINGVRDVHNNLRVSHWDDTGRIPSVTGSPTPTPIGKP